MEYIKSEEIKSKYNIVKPLDSDGHVVLLSSENGGMLVQRTIEGSNLDIYSTLSSLAIPGIPRPLFFSEIDGKIMVFEEYIRGVTLKEILLENGALDKNTVFSYLIQLCDILTPLHNLYPAIIHRDIKPSNVILSYAGQIYLTDFDAATTYMSAKDRDTVLLGTQGYAAPEQYGFNASNPRTDIYALGKLGMELMTGDSHEAGSYSGPFKTILKRCINMDPKNRYEDAAELKQALLANKNNASGLKLPGYRSGKKGYAIMASIIYAFLPFVSMLNLISGNISQFLFGIVFSLSLVIGSMIVFNFRDYLSFFPGTRSSNTGLSVIIRLVYITILLLILLLVLGILTVLFP